jgi:serine/threonine protein kinase
MSEFGDPPDVEDALRSLCLADAVFKERYVGWKLLGRGAYGCVVLSHFLGQSIALKIFTHLSEEGRIRFRTEFQSAVRVTSPCAVRTYSAFERGALCWIEMEAVEGATLKEELERRVASEEALPFARALEVARAVASVLADAHAAGITHRDIKPANILLPDSGRPAAKLGDFGIARIAGAARLTATGAFPGTPQFGAPEAFAGRIVGPPADIYSFSLCLYALFTNNGFPWDIPKDAPLETLITVHTRRAPRSLRSRNPNLPEALSALVSEGLQKSPERRPTAGRVKEVLESIRPSESKSTRHPRGRLIALPAVALVLIVLLGGALATRVSPQKNEGSPQAASPRNTETIPPQASPLPEAPLQASVRGGFLHLENRAQGLRDVRVSLVGVEGAESAFLLPGRLEAEETTDIALEGFAPPPSGALREIRVRATGERGESVEFRVPAGVKSR